MFHAITPLLFRYAIFSLCRHAADVAALIDAACCRRR